MRDADELINIARRKVNRSGRPRQRVEVGGVRRYKR